jgi:predicted lipid-binding transport protein (Tim44 family)
MSSTFPSVSAPVQTHREPDPGWKSARFIAYAALAIALIAIAAVAGVAVWLRPTHASFSDQQVAQAKVEVCMASLAVNKAAFNNANPQPNDPLNQTAYVANVRLALVGGGAYLRDTVAADPATPADLAKAANSMAKSLQQLGVNYLARTDTPAVVNPLQQNLNSAMAQINKICGFKG